jgi:lipid II:glycine glycyltransferase (peptidoglycan interpeptide bridge formation enzyme)
LQPLSAVIWYAMQDAVSNQFKWWNWGGTWFTQKGVYDFKKRWGTQDFNYKYFINTSNDNLLGLSKKQILKEFEYFYTVPFNLLVD